MVEDCGGIVSLVEIYKKLVFSFAGRVSIVVSLITSLQKQPDFSPKHARIIGSATHEAFWPTSSDIR
jgi:hypothetical protein